MVKNRELARLVMANDILEAFLVVTHPLLDALLVLEERAGAAGGVALVDVAVARVADPESV